MRQVKLGPRPALDLVGRVLSLQKNEEPLAVTQKFANIWRQVRIHPDPTPSPTKLDLCPRSLKSKPLLSIAQSETLWFCVGQSNM